MSIGDVLLEVTGRGNGFYNAIDTFNDNERVVTSGSGLNEIYVWNIKTEELLKTISLESGIEDIYALALSPDETKLAIGASPNLERVIDLETENILFETNNNAKDIYSCGWSPDGNKVVFADGYYDEYCRVWDVDSGNIIGSYALQGERTFDLQVTPDCKKVCSCGGWGDNEGLIIWEIETGEILHDFRSNFNTPCWAVAVSQDSDKCAVGDNTGIIIYNYETGEHIKGIRIGEMVQGLDFLPYSKGQYLVISTESGIYLWDTLTSREFSIGNGDIEEVKFTPSGSIVVTGTTPDTGDDTITLFRTMDIQDNIYFREVGKSILCSTGDITTFLDLGDQRYDDYSDIFELEFINKSPIDVIDVTIDAINEATGITVEFSKTLDPFNALSQISFSGPYNADETDTFYLRLNSDSTATPGKGGFDLRVTAKYA